MFSDRFTLQLYHSEDWLVKFAIVPYNLITLPVWCNLQSTDLVFTLLSYILVIYFSVFYDRTENNWQPPTKTDWHLYLILASLKTSSNHSNSSLNILQEMKRTWHTKLAVVSNLLCSNSLQLQTACIFHSKSLDQNFQLFCRKPSVLLVRQ